MVSELFFLFFVPLRPSSANLPKWEKRCSKNWSLSVLPFLSLAGRRQRKKPLLLLVLLLLLLCCNKLMKTWCCFQEFGKHPSFSEIQNGMHSSISRAIHGAPAPTRYQRDACKIARKPQRNLFSRVRTSGTRTQTERPRAQRERERERETMVPHPCGVNQTQISNPALTCETGSQCQNPPYCVKRTQMCKVQTSRETETRDQNLGCAV